MRAGGERPRAAPVRVTRAIKYLGSRAEGHSGPGGRLHPQPLALADSEGAAGEVDDGRPPPPTSTSTLAADAASAQKLLDTPRRRRRRRRRGSDLGTGSRTCLATGCSSLTSLQITRKVPNFTVRLESHSTRTRHLVHVAELLEHFKLSHEMFWVFFPITIFNYSFFLLKLLLWQ